MRVCHSKMIYVNVNRSNSIEKEDNERTRRWKHEILDQAGLVGFFDSYHNENSENGLRMNGKSLEFIGSMTLSAWVQAKLQSSQFEMERLSQYQITPRVGSRKRVRIPGRIPLGLRSCAIAFLHCSKGTAIGPLSKNGVHRIRSPLFLAGVLHSVKYPWIQTVTINSP